MFTSAGRVIASKGLKLALSSLSFRPVLMGFDVSMGTNKRVALVIYIYISSRISFVELHPNQVQLRGVKSI